MYGIIIISFCYTTMRVYQLKYYIDYLIYFPFKLFMRLLKF